MQFIATSRGNRRATARHFCVPRRRRVLTAHVLLTRIVSTRRPTRAATAAVFRTWPTGSRGSAACSPRCAPACPLPTVWCGQPHITMITSLYPLVRPLMCPRPSYRTRRPGFFLFSRGRRTCSRLPDEASAFSCRIARRRRILSHYLPGRSPASIRVELSAPASIHFSSNRPRSRGSG